MGTQDLGTGKRTAILMVAADTLGIPMDQIQLKIGDNQYPPSGGSGGSTTIGGVSSSTRRAAVDARAQLLSKPRAALNAQPRDLEIGSSAIRVKTDPPRSMSGRRWWRGGGGAFNDGQGMRRARADRTGGAGLGRTDGGYRQRRRQRERRARAVPAAHAGPRAGGSSQPPSQQRFIRPEGSHLCVRLITHLRPRKNRFPICWAPPGAKPKSWPAEPTCFL